MPKHVQNNIIKLNISDEAQLFSIVSELNNKLTNIEQKGGANIFDEPHLNDAFNNLSGEHQSQILQLPSEQRVFVMLKIIEKIKPQQNKQEETQLISENNHPLNKAFNALPVHNQVVALQGGYSSMANELKTLVQKVPEETISFKTPVPISEQLAEKYPLLAVETKQTGGNDINDNNNVNDNKETNTQPNEISSSNVKKISFYTI